MKVITTLGTLIIVAVAIFAGVSGYTFYYAKGYSYFSDNPGACANCHIMRDNYKAWQVSSHRSVTCNNCHVPQSFIPKYFVKAENGFRHSYVFTFENVQVLRLKSIWKDVVEDNCQRCHGAMVSMICKEDEERRCLECHRGVGHKF